MKKYYIQTFWCAMNTADSEKINMILTQSWFLKVHNSKNADLIIFNTCSVRQKWEDRVFGLIDDIVRDNKKTKKHTVVWITWCMVRKTWINQKYIEEKKERNRAKKIELLKDEKWIFNNDDKLFPRIKELDFTFRVEELKYLPLILSHIYDEKIWQDDKFDDYLKAKQLRENPSLASVIIQTWCDNYCTYCIVPYTRWKEFSRSKDDIVLDCKEAVKNWAKEITLVWQNVNSYWKQFVDKKLWNEEKSNWNKKEKLNIWVDLDDSLVKVWDDEIISNYNKKFNKNLKFDDIITHSFIWEEGLKNEFFDYYYKNFFDIDLFHWAKDVLVKLKQEWHNFYVITSREKQDIELTYKYLNNKFWENFFEKIIFTKEQGEDRKCVLANKYLIDLVIEDAPHHIDNYIKNTNCKILVFSQPWNKNIKEENNIFIVKSWQDIYEKINKIYTFKSPFRELLEEINKIDWLERIRFTSSNPHDMTRDILDSHFELPKMCNYLHFALQSWSNEILKKMNRKHSYEDFKKQVNYLRSKDPYFAISTDIIVWFSSETEKNFDDTVKAFKELEFDFAYIARYSVRKGTIASKLYPDDVIEEIKAKRWHKLNNTLLETLTKRNNMMLWITQEVLIYWEKDWKFFGRTKNFKEIFFKKNPKYKIWDIVNVKITSLERWVLNWEIIN